MREIDDWMPFEEQESAAQIAEVRALCAQRGWSRVVDLGCGDGRASLPLAREGLRVLALDSDASALAALRYAAEGMKIADLIETAQTDILDGERSFVFADGVRPQVALLLGHTLMELHDVERAAGMFARLRGALEPGGAIVVDNFPAQVWADVRDGAWQEGISEDGLWQMVWSDDGDAVIALRRGDRIDAENWTVREGDRRLRLWSRGALRLLGLSSGWGSLHESPSGALLVFGTT